MSAAELAARAELWALAYTIGFLMGASMVALIWWIQRPGGGHRSDG